MFLLSLWTLPQAVRFACKPRSWGWFWDIVGRSRAGVQHDLDLLKIISTFPSGNPLRESIGGSFSKSKIDTLLARLVSSAVLTSSVSEHCLVPSGVLKHGKLGIPRTKWRFIAAKINYCINGSCSSMRGWFPEDIYIYIYIYIHILSHEYQLQAPLIPWMPHEITI